MSFIVLSLYCGMVFTRGGFFAFSIFRLAFVLVITVAITIVIVAAAPVVLVFVAVMFPIDCLFYLAFSLRRFSHSFGYTLTARNEVDHVVVFFQTILPVNYLIK